MRNTSVFTLALAASVLLACDTGDMQDDTMAEPGQEVPRGTEQPAVPDEMLISVSEFEAVNGAEQAGALPIRGSAELRRGTDEGTLELRVRLEGLPEGDHAWHIHDAPCGEGGSIVVPLSGAGGQEGLTGDLNASGSGVVERTVSIDPEHVQNLDLSSPRALNVHRGPGDNPGPPIACANIGGDTGAAAGQTGAGAGQTAPGGAAPARTGY